MDGVHEDLKPRQSSRAFSTALPGSTASPRLTATTVGPPTKRKKRRHGSSSTNAAMFLMLLCVVVIKKIQKGKGGYR